jgi:hypothetical protein
MAITLCPCLHRPSDLNFSSTLLGHGAAVAITIIVVNTVLVACSRVVVVVVSVCVVETVVCAVTVEVTGAEGLVIKQLHAELIRGASTVARYVGMAPL